MIIRLKTYVACIFISASISAAHFSQRHEESVLGEKQQLTKNGQPRQRRMLKPHVKNACDECKRRHVCCNEVSPGENCDSCKRKNVKCTWNCKKQKESWQPYVSDDEDFLEDKEMPKILQFVLDDKSNNVEKKSCDASEKNLNERPLFRPEKTEISAKNPVLRSEKCPERPKYIKGDAPYSSGAHYPPQITPQGPVYTVVSSQQNTLNPQHASSPRYQCQHCFYQQHVATKMPYKGSEITETRTAFLPANSSEYENASGYFAYGDTTFNQYPYGDQTLYGISAQTPGESCNTVAVYPQAFDGCGGDYEISHEVWYENDW